MELVSLRNKIGQMLIMGFDGCELTSSSPVSRWLSNDGLGGVILFDKDVSKDSYGKNLKDPIQIKNLTNQLKHYASQLVLNREKVPLFIAIDYEGGAVDRLAKIEGCMATINAYDMARLNANDLEEELTLMAETIKSFGFNLNFAPVVDLALNDSKGIIGKLKRAFSDNPDEVAHIATLFVDVFSRHGIASCYKHFPGHGSATGDTHEGFVDVTETYQEKELEPYRILMRDENKPVMIMTAHVINKNLDPTGVPATLSKTILTDILRHEMGYDGVIISDDLHMQAIAKHYSLEESACLTINAGADMIIIANQLGTNTAPQLIDIIEQLVANKKIDPKRIDEAYRRIMRLKKHISCLA